MTKIYGIRINETPDHQRLWDFTTKQNPDYENVQFVRKERDSIELILEDRTVGYLDKDVVKRIFSYGDNLAQVRLIAVRTYLRNSIRVMRADISV